MPISEFEEFKIRKMLGDPSHRFWVEIPNAKRTVEDAIAKATKPQLLVDMLRTQGAVFRVLDDSDSSIDDRYVAFGGLCYLIDKSTKILGLKDGK